MGGDRPRSKTVFVRVPSPITDTGQIGGMSLHRGSTPPQTRAQNAKISGPNFDRTFLES